MIPGMHICILFYCLLLMLVTLLNESSTTEIVIPRYSILYMTHEWSYGL